MKEILSKLGMLGCSECGERVYDIDFHICSWVVRCEVCGHSMLESPGFRWGSDVCSFGCAAELLRRRPELVDDILWGRNRP